MWPYIAISSIVSISLPRFGCSLRSLGRLRCGEDSCIWIDRNVAGFVFANDIYVYFKNERYTWNGHWMRNCVLTIRMSLIFLLLMILTHRMVLLLLSIAWKLQSKEGSKRFANNVVPMIPVGGKCCWCFRSQRCTQPPHLRHPLHTWDVNDIHDHDRNVDEVDDDVRPDADASANEDNEKEKSEKQPLPSPQLLNIQDDNWWWSWIDRLD